jgi:hypothetical protein
MAPTSMMKTTKVAASGISAGLLQSVKDTPQAPPTNGRSFFDLAPEIRNQIYHHLFDNLNIIIQERYVRSVPPHGPPATKILRKREMGLNIIFVSRQCYAKARPILLSAAEFAVDIPAMLTGRRGRSSAQTWPKSLQGISDVDLILVSKIEIAHVANNYYQPSVDKFLRDNIVNQLLAMPRLYALMITVEEFLILQDLETCLKGRPRNKFLEHIVNHGQPASLSRCSTTGIFVLTNTFKHSTGSA